MKRPEPRGLRNLAVSEVFAALGSTPAGIDSSEAIRRLRQFGPNTLEKTDGLRIGRRFVANFLHLMALLLWAGGAVAFIARLPELGIAIWSVNVINGLFSFWQEYRAERATQALGRLLPQTVRLMRDGAECRVLADNLVPGDVVLLEEGDRMSADARIVEANNLRVDQSALTGESRPVAKHARPLDHEPPREAEVSNFVFAGTSVVSGSGRVVVVSTGMESAVGRIAKLTQSVEEKPSPLQVEMGRVTRTVTVIAVGVGLLFFLVAVTLTSLTLAEGFLFALGMIVAFVPEGLLPTVTLALAMGVQRMAKRNALIKRLSAVETLGCTTVICTDKTGTLTQNEMTVHTFWMNGRRVELSGAGYDPRGEVRGTELVSPGDLRELLRCAALCGNARVVAPAKSGGRWSVLGDPMEAALEIAARRAGLDVDETNRGLPRIAEIPFERRRKRMTTIHAIGGGCVAYVKGAPAELLERCTHQLASGLARELEPSDRAAILSAFDDQASRGARVLGLAFRSLSPDGRVQDPSEPAYAAEVERDLTFLGLAAFEDPERPDVHEAMDRCRRAGIRAIMITGDYGLTAKSLAERIGIAPPGAFRVITGDELDALDDTSLGAALRGDVLFARAAPEQKLRVVRALQDAGHVVAVTGDGVNDAPALKQADIGVAMGRSGTDVAKEASDVILADDHFASIVNAVEEGRAVYANLKKFTTYIFTSNAPEAVPFILFALSAGRIPLALNVMQILSIDLGTDLLPALALGVERAEPDVMDRPPRDRREPLITKKLLTRAYLILGTVQAGLAMLAFYFHYWMSGHAGRWFDLPAEGSIYRGATTMTLAAVVATQIGNLFAQRTERESAFRLGWRVSPLIAVALATEIVLLIVIVYTPAMQRVFGTESLPAGHWLFLAAIAPSLMFVDEFRKFLARRSDSRHAETRGEGPREGRPR